MIGSELIVRACTLFVVLYEQTGGRGADWDAIMWILRTGVKGPLTTYDLDAWTRKRDHRFMDLLGDSEQTKEMTEP